MSESAKPNDGKLTQAEVERLHPPDSNINNIFPQFPTINAGEHFNSRSGQNFLPRTLSSRRNLLGSVTIGFFTHANTRAHARTRTHLLRLPPASPVTLLLLLICTFHTKICLEDASVEIHIWTSGFPAALLICYISIIPLSLGKRGGAFNQPTDTPTINQSIRSFQSMTTSCCFGGFCKAPPHPKKKRE